MSPATDPHSRPPNGAPVDPPHGPRRPLPKPSGATWVRWGLIFYGGMAALAVVWRIGLYGEPIQYASAQAEQQGIELLRDLAVGLGAAALLLAASAALTRWTPWGQKLARSMAEMLGPLSVPDALLLAVASGSAEELLFRGALQPRVGWLWASLLFGALHFVPRRELLPWTGFALLAGLVLGALFAITGNLVAPVVAHVVVNGVNLPILVHRYGAGVSRTPR